jgi:hypothetical protein
LGQLIVDTAALMAPVQPVTLPAYVSSPGVSSSAVTVTV